MFSSGVNLGGGGTVGGGGGGGGGTTTIKRQGFITDGMANSWTVTNGTIGQILAVYYNMAFVDTDSYTIAGNTINGLGVLPASPDGTKNVWVVYIE